MMAYLPLPTNADTTCGAAAELTQTAKQAKLPVKKYLLFTDESIWKIKQDIQTLGKCY